MRAVVLVGGFGTRLRPLTCHRPKQMLPIVHRPMLDHVVGHLVDHGIEDVVLSLGFRADTFAAGYPDSTCAGARVHYAVEPEPLDTAGAIRFAATHAGIGERFLVLNGDVLTDLDITRFVEFHDSRGAEATIALHKVDDPSRYGVVPCDGDGRVLEFVEKPAPGEAPTDLINAGTYVLEPSVLARIDDGRRVSVEREVFPALVRDRSLFALDGETYWIDAGTPETYIRAQLDLTEGLRGEPVPAVAASARGRGRRHRAPLGRRPRRRGRGRRPRRGCGGAGRCHGARRRGGRELDRRLRCRGGGRRPRGPVQHHR